MSGDFASKFSPPFGQPADVLTPDELSSAVQVPAEFPRSGQSDLRRMLIGGRDCVVKYFYGGNKIDDNFDIQHGGALTYLASRVQASLTLHNIHVNGPEVLFQDEWSMVTAAVRAGNTSNLAFNLNYAHTRLSSAGVLFDEVIAHYAKDASLTRPFAEDMRAILVDFGRAHFEEVGKFNALFRNPATPRGEVATPIDTHFLLSDFTITPGGVIDMKAVLVDLR